MDIGHIVIVALCSVYIIGALVLYNRAKGAKTTEKNSSLKIRPHTGPFRGCFIHVERIPPGGDKPRPYIFRKNN